MLYQIPRDDWNSKLATVIGITSFGPWTTGEPHTSSPIQCTDLTGFPNYFARVQGGWDWIHETVSGNKMMK